MKRIITLIIALIMLIGLCPDATLAEEISAEKEVQILYQLGFIDEAKPKLTSSITRHSFTKILLKIANSSLSAGSNIEFSDVKSSAAEYQDMALAYELGFISGPDARPNDNITYNEAVKMIICMLGYGPYAEVQGGWPLGYINVAQRQKLIKGVNLSDGFTYGDALKLFYNSLSVNLLDISEVGDGVNYDVVPSTTILSRNHNIYKYEGVLEGASGMTLNSAKAPKDNDVIIDGYRYETKNPDIKKHLGYKIEFYYDFETMEILAFTEGRNDVLTIAADKVSGFSSSSVLTYLEDNKSRQIQIPSNAKVIYNGLPISADKFVSSTFLNSDGSITFIDNDNESGYDVVLIEAYKTYVVKSVNSYTKTIYDFYNKDDSVCLDRENKDTIVTFVDEYNNQMFVEELYPYDVITVKESFDKTLIDAIYSTKEIIGTVTSIEDDGDNMYIGVEGEVYKTTPEFKTKSGIELGEYGLFSLTYDGRVAVINREFGSDVISYGYLMNVGPDKGFNPKYQVKIMDSVGKKHIFYMADKVKLNKGNTKKSSKDTYTYLNKLDNNGKLIQQVIQFSLNKKGEVSVINTSSGENSVLTKKAFSDLLWRPQTGVFGAKVVTDINTKFFYVPEAYLGDDSYYQVNSAAFISGDEESFTMYNDDASPFFADVVVKEFTMEDYNATPTTNDMLVVKKIKGVIKEDGTDALQIDAIAGKQEVSLYTETSSLNIGQKPAGSDNTLVPGDIICYNTNPLGEINYIEIIYDREEDAFLYSGNMNETEIAYENRISKNEVYFVEDGVIGVVKGSVDSNTTTANVEVYPTSILTIIVFDSKDGNDEVRFGYPAEIESYLTTGTGDTAILRSVKQTSGTIVIYK